MLPHRECACHLFNLVAKADAEKNKLNDLHKVSEIHKAGAEEQIKIKLSCQFNTPGDTRGNSTYSAVAKVKVILADT